MLNFREKIPIQAKIPEILGGESNAMVIPGKIFSENCGVLYLARLSSILEIPVNAPFWQFPGIQTEIFH